MAEALQRLHYPQSDYGEGRQHDGDIVAAESDRCADRSGDPQARGCRGAPHGVALAEDRTAADKSDADNQPFRDPGHRFRARGCQGLGRLDKSAGRDRDEGECPQSSAALLAFAVPANRYRERVSDRQRREVRKNIEVVRSEQPVDHRSSNNGGRRERMQGP